MGSKGPGEIMSIVKADRSWSRKMSQAGVMAEINRTTCHGGALNWGPRKKANRIVREMQWSRRLAGQRAASSVLFEVRGYKKGVPSREGEGVRNHDLMRNK